MEKKRVVVVGEGVAGLVAAVYARRAGNEVFILEQGMKRGGLSANWKRNKYHFEGGVHWLAGSSPVMKKLNDLWLDSGALSASNPIHIEDPAIVLYHNRRKLHFHRDLEAFRNELLGWSPQDAGVTDRLCRDISLFRLFMSSRGGLAVFFKRAVNVIPFAVRSFRLWKISVAEYVSSFDNDEIRHLLNSIINPSHTAIALIYTMSAYSLYDCGFPKGGSMILTSNLENEAMGSGVTVLYRQWVSKVVIEDSTVKGVISNGDFIPADEVIVTCDTRKALDNLFDEPIKEKWAERMQRNLVSQQCMFVCLGIRADLFRHPMNLRIQLDEPIEAGGVEFDCLEVYNYAEQHGFAPYKCTSMTVILRADCYDYWIKARKEGTYLDKKREILGRIRKVITRQFPEAEGNIEVLEMATPLTYERFANSWRGGWMSILEPGAIPNVTPVRCRSIRGLHFAGERTMLAGGLPSALLSGYMAAKRLK